MKVILIILFILNCLIIFLCDRLPQPLGDEDYELLFKSLEDGKFTLRRGHSTREKRTYRLIKSGNYFLQMMQDPVTSNEEKKIVCALTFQTFNCGNFFAILPFPIECIKNHAL